MARVLAFALLAAEFGGCTEGTPPPEPGEPIAGLSEGERGRFLLGRALFERLATADEGLGPLYNAERCSDCHDEPVVGGSGSRLLVVKATRYNEGRCDRLEAVGGDNIQRRATDRLIAEGMGPEEVPEEATASVRVTAPSLLGLGLLEAVPDEVLEEYADPQDEDGDGISGRLPRDATNRSARFGRKGDAITIAEFIDTALRFELGFTTPTHPYEESRNGVPIPVASDPAPDPEMTEEAVRYLVDYVRFLAPPSPQRSLSPAAQDSVRAGSALFMQIGCASCHRPEMRAAGLGAADRAGHLIRPYSDLLLHDLGPKLANVCGPDAAPWELRTAPLWGLRFRQRLLHDGSATDIAAAIDAHGGEATTARGAFLALPEEAQARLIRFLASL